MTTDATAKPRDAGSLLKVAALAGLAAPIVYAFGVAVGGFVTPAYSHLANMISELTMAGAPARVPLAAVFVIYNILLAGFAVSLPRANPRASLRRSRCWCGPSRDDRHCRDRDVGFLSDRPADRAAHPHRLGSRGLRGDRVARDHGSGIFICVGAAAGSLLADLLHILVGRSRRDCGLGNLDCDNHDSIVAADGPHGARHHRGFHGLAVCFCSSVAALRRAQAPKHPRAYLMAEEAGNWRPHQQTSCHAAEYPFAHAAVAISARDNQVNESALCEVQNLIFD